MISYGGSHRGRSISSVKLLIEVTPVLVLRLPGFPQLGRHAVFEQKVGQKSQQLATKGQCQRRSTRVFSTSKAKLSATPPRGISRRFFHIERISSIVLSLFPENLKTQNTLFYP
ncbi:MAG: hypothetical protein WBF56_14860, partial [Candidatus Acidiferrales bacterium]